MTGSMRWRLPKRNGRSDKRLVLFYRSGEAEGLNEMAKNRVNKGKSPYPGNAAPPEIPVFSLYGETTRVDDSEFVHIEDIRARSSLYDWHIKPHQHRGLFQILFVARGAVEVQADGQVRTVAVPCALSVPPAVVHGFRFKPRTHGYILTISEAMLARMRDRGLIEDLFVESRVISFVGQQQAAERVTALLAQIAVEMRAQAPGRAAMQEWLVSAVLLLIARQQAHAAAEHRGGRQQRDFARFRALLEAHFLEHWPVGRYAAALQTTESRLNRLTRTVAGKSAFDLIQDRLLLEARRKLTYVAAPISLLAYELGFEDPAYFSRYFRTRVGVTPSAFRREGR
jgi:AraC family transcriptional regulator, transcriptional activator of pobA